MSIGSYEPSKKNLKEPSDAPTIAWNSFLLEGEWCCLCYSCSWVPEKCGNMGYHQMNLFVLLFFSIKFQRFWKLQIRTIIYPSNICKFWYFFIFQSNFDNTVKKLTNRGYIPGDFPRGYLIKPKLYIFKIE